MIKLYQKYKPSFSLYFLFMTVIIIALLFFGIFYFKAFHNPYMQKELYDISNNWSYQSNNTQKNLGILQQVDIKPNEPLILFRQLNESVSHPALLMKSNHQTLRVWVNNQLLYENLQQEGKNPGMGIHLISLPADYQGKVLKIELTSPFVDYSGAPGSIFLGGQSSLTAYAFSRSMLHTLLMVLCIAIGIFMMVLSLLRRRQNPFVWGNFYFGIFSVLWGFYFPSSDYIMHLFFSPTWVSLISIGIYYLYPLPLFIYIYSQLIYCKKAFFPLILLRGLFVLVAFVLQLFHRMDFPELLFINNPLYILSIFYFIILASIEVVKKNKYMKFTFFWIVITTVISMQSMISFYTTKVKQDETLYEMAVFLYILVVWFYNLKEFFHERAKEKTDLQTLQLKNNMVLETYKNTIQHVEEVNLLRHEMKNHMITLNFLIKEQNYEKANTYLFSLLNQQEQLSKVLYCQHPFINALLNVRLSALKEKGIDVTCSIQISDCIYISDEDLSSLFMNILDNAADALTSMGDKQNRYLNLEVKEEKPYLYIYCKNSKTTPTLTKGDIFLSTKKDSLGHGYGLKVISNIAKKYNGFHNISYSKDSFTLELALLNKKEF